MFPETSPKQMKNYSILGSKEQFVIDSANNFVKSRMLSTTKMIFDNIYITDSSMKRIQKLLTQEHDNQRFQVHEWNEDGLPYQEPD